MNQLTNHLVLSIFLFIISPLYSTQVYANSELITHAALPKKIFAEGPTSGQFKYKLKKNAVLINKQPIIGFSAIVVTDKQDIYWFLTDNGFGKKDISADFIPRLYEVNVSANGNATYLKRYLEFTDKDKKLSFPIQADYEHYYDDIHNPKVDSQVIKNRTLTGADIDPESIQIDANNHIWIGEKYGPFLVETDEQGNVLNKEYEIPGIQSKEHPLKPPQEATIGTSGGIEAMAMTPDKQTLHLILQQKVKGDAYGVLRLYTFNIASKSFNESYWYYPNDPGSRVTDMVAIDNQRFYVLERTTKPSANIIYQIDLKQIQNGVLQKTIMLNLNAWVPSNLSLEGIEILDNNRFMIVNDNDGGEGTFFNIIKTDTLLPELVNHAVNHQAVAFKEQKKTLDSVKFTLKQGYFHDNDTTSWFITILYVLATFIFLRVFLLARNYSIDPLFWFILTIIMLVTGLNKQFDIQTDITNYLREIARAEGWYESRAYMQKLLLVIALVSCITIVTATRFLFQKYWIKYKSLCIGFGLLIFYILIRLISLHALDGALRYKIFEIIKVHQLIEVSIIMLLTITSISFNKRYFEKARNTQKRLRENEYLIHYAGEYINCPACYSAIKYPAEHLKNFKCRKCGLLFQTKLKATD